MGLRDEKSNPIVFCKGCKTRRRSKQMQIYNVPIDEYYCNQQCSDSHNEVVR